jgi:hypothetical protein
LAQPGSPRWRRNSAIGLSIAASARRDLSPHAAGSVRMDAVKRISTDRARLSISSKRCGFRSPR